MSIVLIRSATSQSSSYPIVLTRLGEPRSGPNPHLKLWKYRDRTRDLVISSQTCWPLNQRGGQFKYYLIILSIFYITLKRMMARWKDYEFLSPGDLDHWILEMLQHFSTHLICDNMLAESYICVLTGGYVFIDPVIVYLKRYLII